MAPKVSIIVISYYGAEFIATCLKSIVEATKRMAAEIIVVDNGSQDGTPEIIRHGFPEVRLTANAENAGFARAVNQGLEQARGEYIFILNQDTRVHQESLARLRERLEGDPSIGVAGPKFVDFGGRLLLSCRALPRYRDLFFEFSGLAYLFPKSRILSHWKMGWFDHETERAVDQPMGAAMMFRRDLIDRVGRFDERFRIFFNDVDFCRRVRGAGYANLYYPEAVVEHYVGGSVKKIKPRMVMESHRAMYLYFKKYNRSIWSYPALYFWGGILFATALIRAAFHFIFGK